VLANRLKEEGNKYFMSKDYKNALIHYERVLSMSDISKDIYVKTASNQIAALIAWNGTTRNMMEEAKLNLKKAILMEPSNPKLFYRLGEAQEWLGDLNQAIQSLLIALNLNPNSNEIAKRFANVKQKMFYKGAQENRDDRYRAKSEQEVKEKVKMQFPGFNMDNFISDAFQAGFPPALVMQGHIERDFKKDYEAAAKYYERAANADDPEGMLNLSDLYLKGLGVKQDVYKAVELLQKAVKHNHNKTGVVESYNALGLKYFRGTGVEQDMVQAKYWFKKSADLGLADGELNLGCLLKSEGNFSEAIELFKSAAIKGCARAYANLGDLFRDGHGVQKNIDKARHNYQKAVEHGFSMDVEEELKKSEELPLPSIVESWFEQDEKMAKLETIEVTLTMEALQDLEYRSSDSTIARSILIGWQNYQQGVRCLNTMEDGSHDDYILEMFSSTIQLCGHFLEMSEDTDYYLDLVIESVLKKQTVVDPIDLAVCGFYMRYPPKDLPKVFHENWYLSARTAIELNKLGEQRQALDIIHKAIAENPKNLDLRFYKARILGNSEESYLKFIKMAPDEHYWRPRAFYCIAEILMKKNQNENVLQTYNSGLSAEKSQLKLFQKVDWEEKRTVALYLLENKKFSRCPSFLKSNDARRKELITHHHSALRDHLDILLGLGNKYIKTMRTTLNKHRRQPDPTANSRQREFLFEDLDLTKEHIYIGFIDCLILAPPLKNFGIVTVVEDKKGTTCRALLYDDISLVHIKVGQWIRIYNPYIRIAADNRSAIKVTNRDCFEVLQYENICHYCTDEITNNELLYCERCNVAKYCSRACFEKHWHDYQHSVCCHYLSSIYPPE
jgi:TPR repeat protein